MQLKVMSIGCRINVIEFRDCFHKSIFRITKTQVNKLKLLQITIFTNEVYSLFG